MKTILISVLMLFAMQSKASISDTLTEVRVDSIVYVGHIEIVNNTVYIESVNTIKVEANNVSTIYINSKATTLKYVVVEPIIKVDYNIVSKFNNK